MRAPATLLKGGISAAAALLLLTGCGGSDDEQTEATPSSSAASGSAESGGTSDEDVQAFCTEAESIFTELSSGLDAAQPEQLSATLDQGVSALGELEPPAEISADWGVLQQAFTGLRDAVAGADLTTPEGQASVQQAVTDLSASSGEAQTNLDTWVTENCDNA